MHRSENLNWPSEWNKLLEGLKSISEAGELNRYYRMQQQLGKWLMIYVATGNDYFCQVGSDGGTMDTSRLLLVSP